MNTETNAEPNKQSAVNVETDAEPNKQSAVNVETDAEPNKLSDSSSEWLDSHLKEIRNKIIKRSREILQENGDHTIASAIPEAANEFAPGTIFPNESDQSWWQTIISQLSAVTFISALLAIVFGLIAYNVSIGEGATAKDVASYIDLVKIFAGAVVGSTGAAVAASATKKGRKT